MIVRIQKWGNSLAVRIPRAFAAETGIGEGTEIDMGIEGDELRIRAVPRPTYRLADLVAGITAENVHAEADFGPSAGQEIW